MARTDAEQRAEVARLLAAVDEGTAGYWAERRLLELLPALLADAAALAARERADDEQAGDARWHSLMGRE